MFLIDYVLVPVHVFGEGNFVHFLLNTRISIKGTKILVEHQILSNTIPHSTRIDLVINFNNNTRIILPCPIYTPKGVVKYPQGPELNHEQL